MKNKCYVEETKKSFVSHVHANLYFIHYLHFLMNRFHQTGFVFIEGIYVWP